MNYINEQERRKIFEQFFILTFPKVKAFAYKILKSEDDAEDIAQDVFVKIWADAETWKNCEMHSGYIYIMVRNQVFNFLKHKSIASTYEEQLAGKYASSFQADIHDELYAKEIELLMKLTVSRMPEQRRKVFIMSRQQHMSNNEIAEKLNISIRTVERHLYLALAELKKIILFLFFFYLR
ncbi:MAG: RNA polymerase sigma-70 factor [Bacteroides sp.]|uniref:RNA polymerase sigma-70 factor n=1 Tax=Bacteroides sp. TaxID=29523 RepID=UPI002FC915CF